MLQVTEIALPMSGVGSSSVIAIAGILGTLAGAALGAFVTWRIQKRQLEHEDRTCFHDRRLSTCAEFTYACGYIVAPLRTSVSIVDQSGIFVRGWETLRLIGSLPVVYAATRLHADTVQAMKKQVTDVDSFMVTYNAHMVDLLNAIRQEINVGAYDKRVDASQHGDTLP